jgi:hypothetical protein
MPELKRANQHACFSLVQLVRDVKLQHACFSLVQLVRDVWPQHACFSLVQLVRDVWRASLPILSI